MGRVRSERRAVMARMKWFPIVPRDFSRRESSGLRRWNNASQRLQRSQLEIDKLRAVANGLQRLLRERDRFFVSLDAATEARVRAELQQTEAEIADYLARVDQYRESIEGARMQVGFGDARYQNDDHVRDQFNVNFDREMELALAGQAGASAAAFARETQTVMGQLAQLESKLSKVRDGLLADVAKRAAEVEVDLREEQKKLEEHQRALAQLDEEARVRVGEAAMRNFERVRERLSSIVLRADVGITHQAWEVRESHLERVQTLQRERSQEEKSLQEELDEVLFEGEKRE